MSRFLALAGLGLSAALILIVPFFVRGWARKLGCMALGVGALVATCVLGYPSYRRHLDAERVANVNAIYEIIEMYKDTTGRCPLEDRFHGEPIGVNISSRPLPEQFRRPPPGARGSIVPYEEFLAELRAGLKSPVNVPTDSQKVPFGPPHFYQYHLMGTDFFVAASLWFERPGTKQLGWHYYKYELHGSCRTTSAR